MKIALLTFECPPADYRSLSFPNKEKYCLKHGYDFLSYTERASDRPPSWDKIKYLQKHIDNYDWIFWTDSDSVIVNDDIRLEAFIDTEKDLIIQIDEALDKTRAINAGQIFLKNSEWGKWFLNEVWNNEKYGTSIDDGDWEQSCIKKIIGDEGEKFPNEVRVYQDIHSGFNVVPSLATSDTFMVHFRRDHRDGYKQILKKIANPLNTENSFTLHSIWLSSGPEDKKTYATNHAESVEKFFPKWKRREWGEKNSDTEEVYNLITKTDERLTVCLDKYIDYPVIISDVARICLIYKYGGAYVDYDSEFRSSYLSDLVEKDPTVPFFMIERYSSSEIHQASANFKNRNGQKEDARKMGNALFYAPPNNKIIKSIINVVAERLNKGIQITEGYDVMWMTGPDTFSTVINRTKEKHNLIGPLYGNLTEREHWRLKGLCFGGDQSTICEFFNDGQAKNHWRQQLLTKKKRVNLIYIGNFSGPSGYSVAARGYFKILSNHPEINVKVLNITHGATGEEPLHLDWYIIRNESEVPKNSVVFYHIEPGEKQLDEAIRYGGINIRKIIQNARKRFILFAWEPCGVPPYWKDFFNTYFDELITFCKFQSKNISEFIEKPIHVLPHLMMLPSKINGTVSNKFRILSMSQWSYRKGFDILIQAFSCEFFNNEDVELTIKTFGRNGTPQEKETIIKEIQQYKLNCARHKKFPECQIKLWYGGIPSSQINTLYDNIDLYVSTTRGEGFGLTIAEALCKGKRVIVPDKGGHLDYIYNNNYFIKSRLETLRCADWSTNYSSEFKLVEPDFEDTRLKLREAYNDFKNSKPEWVNKQKESTIFTKNYLSEDVIKKKLEKIIDVKHSALGSEAYQILNNT